MRACVIGAVALVDDAARTRIVPTTSSASDAGADADGCAVLAEEPHQLLARRVVVRRDELTGEEALEILGERAGVLVARLRVVGERLVDDRRELGRHARRRSRRAASAARRPRRASSRRRSSCGAAAGARAGDRASRRARRRRSCSSTGSPRSCSGAMKPGVPNTMPARVLSASSSSIDALDGRVGSSASPIAFARPQSITIVSPRSPTRMFDGLMSRWTMPRSCACAIACAAATMCGSEREPRVERVGARDELFERAARRPCA